MSAFQPSGFQTNAFQAQTNLDVLHVASGGVQSGGAADVVRSYSVSGSGGLSTGGAAAVSFALAVHAQGGLVLGGAAIAGRVYTYIAQPAVSEAPPPAPSEPQIIVQPAGVVHRRTHTTCTVYVGGGGVRLGGMASRSFRLLASHVRPVDSGPGLRLRVRGSANAYVVAGASRRRDLEDLALANLARRV